MLRLHVIANSDSEVDQALKLRVRDAVLFAGKNIFSSDDTRDEAIRKINKNRDLLLSAAEEEIKQAGFDYPVRLEIGNYFFPAKKYENLSLPAGNYDAVRVVIGEGAGKNWWCVMFPPLCFVSSSIGEIPEDAADTLRECLDNDEYALITSEGNIPVSIRFKIVDFIQSSANSIKTALKK